MKYRVIKSFDGWETKAGIGDILYLAMWEGHPTLMLYGKAVCDVDSPYAEKHCEIIPEG
ncbi:hypothetical protein [Paenibacillus sp. FJAT-26967]|uniref:hypothetical protein n=1 Tax=Paenibacillus sp. FJAT-26967 TaxID=1729690 RepID=UPI000AC498E7|nr:hypothetical protein [Paenibacillus sp. FJAT-26967]